MNDAVRSLLERFARPFFGADVRPRSVDVPLDRLRAEASDARTLLESDAYVAAYQRSLDQVITELLGADLSKPEGRDRAIWLISKAQQHQQIAEELAATVHRYNYEQAERARKSRRAA